MTSLREKGWGGKGREEGNYLLACAWLVACRGVVPRERGRPHTGNNYLPIDSEM